MTLQSEDAAREWVEAEFGFALGRLSHFAELLLAENARQNLIAAATVPMLWQRHIADSAQLLRVPRETPDTWLDLGTGAGFPGMIVALLAPDTRVTLVESRRLRATWLRHAANELGLRNVNVEHRRVEVLDLAPVSVISARAFAPLERLLSIASRFSTAETLWMLPKGARAAQELGELPRKWRHVFHVEQSITDPTAGIVVGHLLGQDGAKASRPQKGSAS